MKIIQLAEVESTNSYAKSHIDELTDCTAVYALKQTAGRGRLNRQWVDLGDENLYLSIVLKPSETFNDIYPNLTQYLSVVLSKVLESYGLKPQIKWPNDVLIEGKKIAGILSEVVMQGQTLKGIVLGIGVNLNAKQEDIDAIPDKIATSLNLELKKYINREDFLNKLLEEFYSGYKSFLDEGFAYIKNDYIARNCFLNKELSVHVFNDIKSGFAKSVNNSGELILQTKNDNDLVLTIGDIL